MLIARLLFGLLAVASVICFVAYMRTGDPRWRRFGVVIIKWTLIAAFGFFAVLIAERIALMR